MPALTYTFGIQSLAVSSLDHDPRPKYNYERERERERASGYIVVFFFEVCRK